MPIPNLSDLFAISFILVLIFTAGRLVSLGQAIGRSLGGDSRPTPAPGAPGDSAENSSQR